MKSAAFIVYDGRLAAFASDVRDAGTGVELLFVDVRRDNGSATAPEFTEVDIAGRITRRTSAHFDPTPGWSASVDCPGPHLGLVRDDAGAVRYFNTPEAAAVAVLAVARRALDAAGVAL